MQALTHPRKVFHIKILFWYCGIQILNCKNLITYTLAVINKIIKYLKIPSIQIIWQKASQDIIPPSITPFILSASFCFCPSQKVSLSSCLNYFEIFFGNTHWLTRLWAVRSPLIEKGDSSVLSKTLIWKTDNFEKKFEKLAT